MNTAPLLKAYFLLNSNHDYSTRPILDLMKSGPYKVIRTCRNLVLVEAHEEDIQRLMDSELTRNETDYFAKLKRHILNISIQETM